VRINSRTTRARSHGTTGSQTTSGDEVGCFLILLLILWSFGFVSFHWRDQDSGATRLEELKVQLSKAEAQLVELTKGLRELERQSESLSAERASLKRQVDELQHTRDEIASALQAAAQTVAPSKSSRFYSFGEYLLNRVIGNLVSAGLLAALAWFHGRRMGRLNAQRPSDAEDNRS
jgi:hypothetical protein